MTSQPNIAFFIFDYRTHICKRFAVFTGYGGKCLSIINPGIAPGTKPNFSCFIFNNSINIILHPITFRNLLLIGRYLDRIGNGRGWRDCHFIISKGFSIVTACSTLSTKPDLPGFLFLNLRNPIIRKSILCCKISQRLSIVIINT